MWSHPESHPGEYLKKRFLEPLGLSASDLARRCGMPRSRVSDIVTGKRGITADTALRLAALFRMDPRDWLALQAEWELGQFEPIDQVDPLDPPGFLLGPLGATPLPAPQPKRLDVTPSRPEPIGLAAEPAAQPYGERRVHDEVRYPDGTRALVSRTKPPGDE